MIPVAADAEQALAMIRSHPDGTVVDVRDEEEYITGHLADAVLLPVDEISAETAAEALPNQSSPVLVYCKTGKRSHAARRKTRFARIFQALRPRRPWRLAIRARISKSIKRSRSPFRGPAPCYIRIQFASYSLGPRSHSSASAGRGPMPT